MKARVFVTLKPSVFDPQGQTIVYQLVMPEDANPEQGLISTASPIGRALVNREEGDEVNVTTPNGSRQFEVIKLVTVHEPIR